MLYRKLDDASEHTIGREEIKKCIKHYKIKRLANTEFTIDKGNVTFATMTRLIDFYKSEEMPMSWISLQPIPACAAR